MIEVVNGVIVRQERIILTQRRADQDFPYAWELPGGKVEGLHESHHSALRRELKEEIDIEVGDIPEHAFFHKHFNNHVTRPDRAEVFVLLYLVVNFKGVPRPKEGQGLGSFTAWEFRHLKLAPAADAARGELERIISWSSTNS